ncbi:CRISPR-associated protein Csx3 [Desulfothermus sp.]
MTIEFRTKEKENYTIVHFELKENITPKILQQLKPPKVDETKGIVIYCCYRIWSLAL